MAAYRILLRNYAPLVIMMAAWLRLFTCRHFRWLFLQQGLKRNSNENNQRCANEIEPEKRHNFHFVNGDDQEFAYYRTPEYSIAFYFFNEKSHQKNAENNTVKKRTQNVYCFY